MAKNTNRVASAIACVAALGLATGISANHWEIGTPEMLTYATEIFGEKAAELELDTPGVTVELMLVRPDNEPIATTSKVDLTFQLRGAVFGTSVKTGDISVVNENGQVATGVTISGRRDGRVNDPSVSFTLALAEGGMIRNGYKVVLKMPELTGAASLATATAEVRVNVEAVLEVSSSGVNFPEDVCPPMVAAVEADLSAMPPVVEVVGVAACAMDNPNSHDNVIATSAEVMAFSSTPGAGGDIKLDDRTSLTAPKVSLGGLSLDASTRAYQADGLSAFTIEDGGEGQINITVKGDLRDDDIVYFDQDGDGTMGTREGLEVADSMAKGDFRLSSAFLSDSEAVAKARMVYYTPNGEDVLKKGEFVTEFAIEFDEASNKNPGAETVKGVELDYAGVDQQAIAYAIPPVGSTDVGNVRIKCEMSEACTVFLDCEDQDGMPYFGEVIGEIPGRSTRVLQSDHDMSEQSIMDALGADGWAGRLSCRVLSSGKTSVQVLVRSGGSLINNTYVSGPAD
jgi:hypothetical protein